MARLMRAFFYKLSKDITFRITLIIGAGIAFFMTGLYLILQNALGDELEGVKMLSGQTMLISSFSPVQNFGLAIPINLISFIYLEFSQGTIRNKIIAGHSKAKIYTSLYLSGLVFAFALLLVYIGLCTGLGTIFGGFDPNGYAMAGTSIGGKISGEFLIKFSVLAIFSYVSIVSFTIFVVTTFRNMGPSIPVVILALFACYFLAMILSVAVSTVEMTMASEMQIAMQEGREIDLTEMEGALKTFKDINNVLKVVDPLYGISVIESNEAGVATVDNLSFFGGIGSNLVFAGLFFGFGCLEFSKRDVK